MYRLCVTYQEDGSVKNVYSLWYSTKEDAARQGRKNIVGLYAEKCVEQGLAQIVMETKSKKVSESHVNSFYPMVQYDSKNE